MGVILGTAAYMSPEQARGWPVDKRADIWAFGVVLFEMLTGCRVFEGQTVSDTLAAVLRADIDLSALPASTPPAVRRLLTRCLDRDPKTRLRDIGEARVILASPLEPAAAASTSLPVAWWQRPLAIAGLGIATLIAGAFGAGLLAPAQSTAPVISSRFELPVDTYSVVWSDDGRQLAWTDPGSGQGSLKWRLFRVDYPWTAAPTLVAEGPNLPLAVLPDGRRVVVSINRQSFVVNVDGSGTPVPIEPGAVPSPDGRWVAYREGTSRREIWVRPEPAAAKARWLIGESAGSKPFWSGDGRELFYLDEKQQLQSVTVRGPRPDAPFELGRPVALKVPADIDDLVALTPDGKRFLAIRELPSAPPRLAIVQNFFEELRAKVPVK
jgi:hypothetical protein